MQFMSMSPSVYFSVDKKKQIMLTALWSIDIFGDRLIIQTRLTGSNP